MKNCTHIVMLCALIELAASGCAPDWSRTHRGDVIDDRVTTQRVQAELARAGSRFKDIHVETRDNVVVLSGNVTTEETRTEAEDIARKIHRRTQLEDDIRVQQ